MATLQRLEIDNVETGSVGSSAARSLSMRQPGRGTGQQNDGVLAIFKILQYEGGLVEGQMNGHHAYLLRSDFLAARYCCAAAAVGQDTEKGLGHMHGLSLPRGEDQGT